MRNYETLTQMSPRRMTLPSISWTELVVRNHKLAPKALRAKSFRTYSTSVEARLKAVHSTEEVHGPLVARPLQHGGGCPSFRQFC